MVRVFIVKYITEGWKVGYVDKKPALIIFKWQQIKLKYLKKTGLILPLVRIIISTKSKQSYCSLGCLTTDFK